MPQVTLITSAALCMTSGGNHQTPKLFRKFLKTSINFIIHLMKRSLSYGIHTRLTLEAGIDFPFRYKWCSGFETWFRLAAETIAVIFKPRRQVWFCIFACRLPEAMLAFQDIFVLSLSKHRSTQNFLTATWGTCLLRRSVAFRPAARNGSPVIAAMIVANLVMYSIIVKTHSKKKERSDQKMADASPLLFWRALHRLSCPVIKKAWARFLNEFRSKSSTEMQMPYNLYTAIIPYRLLW